MNDYHFRLHLLKLLFFERLLEQHGVLTEDDYSRHKAANELPASLGLPLLIGRANEPKLTDPESEGVHRGR
jgi:hypothetical protein